MDAEQRHEDAALTDASQQGRGRDADKPTEIPKKGLRDVFWRLINHINEYRVMLIAAGVTYYLLLSLFPALGALVSLYGFVADPASIGDHIKTISSVLPPGGVDIILSQLNSLASQKTSTLSFGFFSGLLIALWSANNGIKALFEAMNVAYGENEKRSFVWLNLVSLFFTICSLILMILLIFLIGIIPALLSMLWLDSWTEAAANIARWPLLLLLMGGGISVLYRFGPSRAAAKTRWISPGVIFSTLAWVVTSIAFSYYLQNFANYNATYGTLGALIGFLIWTWISVTLLIVGAQINAELEHQTALDTTTGSPQPMGQRGAYVADTLGKSCD